jgi:hypothetical protein
VTKCAYSAYDGTAHLYYTLFTVYVHCLVSIHGGLINQK